MSEKKVRNTDDGFEAERNYLAETGVSADMDRLSDVDAGTWPIGRGDRGEGL